jgi:hypothetical protein
MRPKKLSVYRRANPLFPASGLATGSLNGLNPKSNFLAKPQLSRWSIIFRCEVWFPRRQPPFPRLRSGHRLP